eukprot:Opistho-1_new@105345
MKRSRGNSAGSTSQRPWASSPQITAVSSASSAPPLHASGSASRESSQGTSREDVREEMKTPARNLVKIELGANLVTPETKAPPSPALGYKEICHIRATEVRIRLDDLNDDEPALCDDVRAGRACLVCALHGTVTKFGFTKWAWPCSICGFKACGDCCAKVTIAEEVRAMSSTPNASPQPRRSGVTLCNECRPSVTGLVVIS